MRFLHFLTFFLLSGFVFAQKNAVINPDNIQVTIKEKSYQDQVNGIIEPDSSGMGQPVFYSDTLSSDSSIFVTDSITVRIDSVELSLSFEIKDFSDIKWIELRYGTVEGEGNLLAIDLLLLKKNNKYYLKDYYGGTEFPVNNGIVEINRLSSREALNTNGYIGITVKDSNHKEIYKLNKSAQ